jgi:predicted HTH domain antitoxin
MPHADGVAYDISLGRAAEILRISREDMRKRAADWAT